MNGLPKDVIAIVQRYVFDELYTQVKQQYLETYVKTKRTLDGHVIEMCWDKNYQCFVRWNGDNIGTLVANWRRVHNGPLYTSIKRISGVKHVSEIRRVADLPKCYFNCNGSTHY